MHVGVRVYDGDPFDVRQALDNPSAGRVVTDCGHCVHATVPWQVFQSTENRISKHKTPALGCVVIEESVHAVSRRDQSGDDDLGVSPGSEYEYWVGRFHSVSASDSPSVGMVACRSARTPWQVKTGTMVRSRICRSRVKET